MNATPAEIETLERIQAIDLDLMRSKKELEELPQRGIIATARQKRASLEEKLEQISALRKETSRKVTRAADEDASLVKKEHGVQAAINAAQGDYRNVEARSKELMGIEKRRFALSEQLEQLKGEMSKIDKLSAQVTAAIEKLNAEEQAATESFKKEGGALTEAIQSLKVQRESLAQGVGAELMGTYDRILARSGGVAIGHLADSRCGICRASIDSGRLIDLRSQAPLGECPSCKRLLIIG